MTGAGPAGGRGADDDILEEVSALVGVPARALESDLEKARALVERVIADEATATRVLGHACRLLLRIDERQRSRARLPDDAVGALSAFTAAWGRADIIEVLADGSEALHSATGLQRTLFSFVSSAHWRPRHFHAAPSTGFERSANERMVRRFVTGAAWPLEEARLEADVVAGRESTLVASAQTDRRTFAPLMRVSASRSYVVAPVEVRDRVVGLLHGDRWGPPVDDGDLRVVSAYAHVFGVAIERAMLRHWLSELPLRAARRLEHEAGSAVKSEEGAAADGLRAATRAPTDGASAAAAAAVAGLSAREREVLTGLARGLSNADIAGRLGLRPETVKAYVRNVLRKLGVRSRAGAAAALRRAREERGG